MASEMNVEDLLKLYGTDVLRFIRFYTKNDNDAEDLTQEVFIKAHCNLDNFRYDCNPKTWLIQVAINVCRNYHRSTTRRPQVLVDKLPFTEISPSAEAEFIQRSEATELIRLVQELPILQKEVVLLHYFEEESLASIAQILGVTVSTVKIRLFRARQALKRRKELALDEERNGYSRIFTPVETNG